MIVLAGLRVQTKNAHALLMQNGDETVLDTWTLNTLL